MAAEFYRNGEKGEKGSKIVLVQPGRSTNIGLFYEAFHTLGARGQYKFGVQRGEELPPFNSHGIGHGKNDTVTL